MNAFFLLILEFFYHMIWECLLMIGVYRWSLNCIGLKLYAVLSLWSAFI